MSRKCGHHREINSERGRYREKEKEGLNKKVGSWSRKCGHHREITSERRRYREKEKERKRGIKQKGWIWV